MTTLGILGVPSSAGGRRTGQERAPAAFRQAGLVEQLCTAGVQVEDRGDLDEVRYTPDTEHPRQQNVARVRGVAIAVAEAVEGLLQAGLRPLVLGGDCTITLGVLAGLVRRLPRLGLIYFDGDADLKTPADTRSGILDGMGMAHILGHGVDALSRLGPCYPLLPAERILLFGLNPGAGWMGEVERQRLEASALLCATVGDLRGRTRAAARAAPEALGRRADHLLLHLDVDVIDCEEFPAAEVPHRGALGFEEAFEAVRVFVASPRLAGLVITEFNAELDPDATLAQRLVAALVDVLRAAPPPDW